MDFDVIVIGAGIHGAAVAQAAAAAGYRTFVIEQYDAPALGTSSKSSKLIHGGLRYLESGQFGLVRECLVERQRLLANAPHLVKLVPFHIPVYRDSQRGPLTIRLGLSLYTLLGGKAFDTVPATQWQQLDGLHTEDLKAVFRYYDAQTDDAALTRAMLASATTMGAEIRYRCSLEAAHCDDSGCRIEYRQDHEVTTQTGAVIINATGPWVNTVLQNITPPPHRLAIDLVQGTHLIIPGSLSRGMYYLEAPRDRRAVFVMPWQQNILLGTTETLFEGDPAGAKPLETEIEYLLEVYNHYFETRVERSQLIDAFAGLRVLPRSEGPAFHRSRDTLLHIDKANCPRVLTIYGGKLTSHRATAEKVIQAVAGLLPERRRLADTRYLRLP
jgi:glycerol-3-phosphate dehydrogenase